ncbi:Rad51 family DNA repair protein [Lasiodiplodia theobromae]|uniref:Rad51 family DNA repair protein n=1 Tax=Lasiodiplodia theobromae TaxID=45133 RepID=UPI0015C3E3E9|nr:Rad51 family DNA repair protein [Lasiodiplodia theobromae]KAF4537209.1 Rad51 family DNA repair protein [Lasiodiplodia theobromae]
MGAEALGRRLLGEVEEARLDEVLRSVSLSAQPELSEEGPFGIRPLDRLLRLFEQQQQQQQQQQPVARQQHDPGSPPPGQPQRPRTATTGAPKPPPIIELTSANPGAGKTQLLYLLITHAILPRTYDGIPLSSSSSGHAGAVVVVDADNRFCAARLAAVARSHVLRRSSAQKKKLDSAAIDALITASLAHVHVLQPQSHAALLAALRALPAYLFAKGEGLLHGSACRPLRAVFVDSVSAFFWPLRAVEDDARVLISSGDMSGGESGKSGRSSTTTSEAYAALARELRGLSARFGCVVVTTSVASASPFASSASSSSSSSERHRHHPALRPLLPASWHAAAAGGLLHLGVERVRVRGFAPAMSVAEARAERGQRQSVVEEGRFGVWVDGWGAEAWPRGLWEGLGAMEGRGRWGFYVRGDGVVVEGEEDGGEGEEGVVEI